MKNGSNMYLDLGDDGAKESVKICDRVNFEDRKTASCLLKGQDHDKTHVTLIQERICQGER